MIGDAARVRVPLGDAEFGEPVRNFSASPSAGIDH
jgi:hypothetical protein